MGSFCIKSEYWMLKDRSWNPRDVTWKNDWKFQGPQKVRIFIWILFKQRLLTNVERERQSIGHDSSCLFCGHESEDVLHVIRDCFVVREVWLQVILGSLDGLVILQGCGYERVTIQGDCLEMVKVLQDTPSAALGSALIRHIQQLLMHAGH
ncbi:hypothetical protein Goklo_013691 [Gossypium klotzschianum]|uniref:Reverse transcriptase zinc-binding domain-containing protein n=1 Tax=Gossypium klotzschianum TaxID=34286 RepID=A0A7J8U5F1_9ROSI|nr:hypothetical protein [Gossypium klotzschianum]